jgi:dystroglycan 1
VYAFELGGGAAQIISRLPVNDGQIHRVRAERQGRNGSLIIDRNWPLNGTSSGILAMLNVEGNIYMGGLPNLSQMTLGIHTQNFVGCIANFKLNGQPLDLMANAIDGRNVKPCETWPTETKKKWLKDLRRTRRRLRKKLRRY